MPEDRTKDGVYVPGGRRRIDRILVPSFLENLASLPLAEVRARRAECEEEETLLSYERRLLHGRMDILRAEVRRRGEGSSASLVEDLAQILTDDAAGAPRTSRGAFPREVPVPDFENSKRRVEQLVSDDTLARVPDLPEEEIESILARLAEAEREVSEQRRHVQVVLDSLTAEVGRRYKTGEADPTDVLRGGR